MGVMPEGKLLLTMAIPMMLSMLAQSLYNIVDSVFVSRIHEDALTALSLAFPFQMLIFSVVGGFGVGMNALLSRALGQKNFERANQVANNGLWIAACSYILFALLTQFGAEPFFRAQTSDPRILEYSITYMRIIGILCFGMISQVTLERLLQSTGKTFYSMVMQITGAAINCVMDPILIFGLFGLPKLGIAGAATATIFGQLTATGLGIYFNLKKNTEIRIAPFHYRPSLKIIRGISAIGVPSIIMMSIGSVTTFGMNKILISFTSTAVAVYGSYFKLQSFIFMPIFGMNNAMIPIVAYNYGARKPERIIKTIKLAVVFAVCIMAVGLVLFQTVPGPMLRLFDASANMEAIGVHALRVISIHFLIAGFCIVCMSVFQAFGHGVMSLLVSMLRQLIFLLPAAYILSRIGGLDAVWWCFPIAELASLCISSFCLRRVYRKDILPLRDPVPEGVFGLPADGYEKLEEAHASHGS